MPTIKLNHITELRITTIFLRKDGIIQLNIEDDVILHKEDIDAINVEINRISMGEKFPILVITGERNSSTRAARKASMEQLRNENYALAEALVINSLSTRMAANFFFKIFKPKFPYKNFRSKKNAIAWLNEFQ